MSDNATQLIALTILLLAMTTCHGIDRFADIEDVKIECEKIERIHKP